MNLIQSAQSDDKQSTFEFVWNSGCQRLTSVKMAHCDVREKLRINQLIAILSERQFN